MLAWFRFYTQVNNSRVLHQSDSIILIVKVFL